MILTNMRPTNNAVEYDKKTVQTMTLREEKLNKVDLFTFPTEMAMHSCVCWRIDFFSS